MPSSFVSWTALKKFALIALLGGTLSACGGGGGGGSDPRTGTGGTTGGDTVDGTTGQVKIGSGTGTAFSQGTAAASSTSLQAGASTTISINLVDEANAPVSDEFSVEFSSNCVASSLSSFSETTVATSSGLASSVYTANGCSGSDLVTVRANVDGVDITATVTLNIEADQVLAVEFVSVANSQLSLAGLGGQETTQVTFRLVGEQSAPIIGEMVSFTVSGDTGGVTLADGTESAVTDSQGNVTTVVQSGTVPTSVSVTATHNATGIQGISNNISISTGVPVQSRFTLSAERFNPPEAFGENGIEVGLSIIASDQYGNDAPDGTRISFVSPESGNIDSSCLLVSGECSVTWRSSSPRPDDMRFTVIAYTSGAEDFEDQNANNIFDDNAEFTVATHDLTEAFADENENDAYDLGEFFVDNNVNTVFDLGDGVWNGPCLTGTDASALCPGEDSIVIFDTLDIVMPFNGARIYDIGTFPAVGSTIAVGIGSSVSYGNMRLADTNTNPNYISGGTTFTGNSLPGGTTVEFTIENAATGVDVDLFGDPTWEIDTDTTLPNGFFGVTIIADPDSDPGAAFLVMKVTFPDDTEQSFLWNLSVN